MALLDLSSDLSRYRSEVSKVPVNTPEASKAKNNKNFATYQPLTQKFLGNAHVPDKNKIDASPTKLNSMYDNISKKRTNENLILNSISEFSPTVKNTEFNLLSRSSKLSIEEISTKLNDIKKGISVSKMATSDVVITKTNPGKNNNESVVDINYLDKPANIEKSNITIDKTFGSRLVQMTSKLQTYRFEQTDDKIKNSANIVKNARVEEIKNPNIQVERTRTNSPETQLSNILVINKDFSTSINNLIDPNISINYVPRESIHTVSTIQINDVPPPENFVSTININKMDNSGQSVFQVSRYSTPTPVRFTVGNEVSQLSEKGTPNIIAVNNNVSEIETINSQYDIDIYNRTNVNRLENIKTIYSFNSPTGVNYFPDTNSRGFVVNQNNETAFVVNSSALSWKGKRENAPVGNYFPDTNSIGFTTFQQQYDTKYILDSSRFGFKKVQGVDFLDTLKRYTAKGFETFSTQYQSDYIVGSSLFSWDGSADKAPTVNYFDRLNKNTNDGFHKFAQLYDTKYKTDSSIFDWKGTAASAPTVNYFDRLFTNTTDGFHRFAQLYDTKYKTDSSIYDWDGKREDAPVVNYFDIRNSYTNDGFHKFAQLYDTKYIPESSIFDWDGKRGGAPVGSYFDINNRYTTDGFHAFAQLYDTKYIPESSIFDWDGVRENAPSVNYFDIRKQNTVQGFHTFAKIYDTKYIPESSIFDWDGKRKDAPAVDFFDIRNRNTTTGFHTFAQLYDTKYIPESSIFDWDGKREQAPAVDFFDISKRNTFVGFHTFAQLYDTKYVPESSIFDWDGKREQAPSVDFFDISKRNTFVGFHTFAQMYDTKYVPESSIFDWDGKREQAPSVDFFDISKRNTFVGFHTFAQLYDTKYVPESSIFDWDGKRKDAPAVDFFDISKRNTFAGFHTFAQLYDTKYVPESSIFDWDGKREQAPSVDFFDIRKQNTVVGFHTFAQIYDSKYIPESSIFDWDGKRKDAPAVDFFDIRKQNTVVGFHTFAQIYDTKYVAESSIFDWDGKREQAPEVNYFDVAKRYTQIGFHKLAKLYDSKYIPESSIYDWDGRKQDAPAVNYFDISNRYTTDGFHILAQKYDTKYKIDSSVFDWDGKREQAPSVNFFTNTNHTGFSTFSKLYQSEYNNETSAFSFIGNEPPPLDVFSNRNAKGFRLRAQVYQTDFNTDTSIFVFKGGSANAPNTDFFQNQNQPGFIKFQQMYDSAFKNDTSRFTFVGNKNDSPNVDYIQNTNAIGFNKFAKLHQSLFNLGTSAFSWKGGKENAPEVNYLSLDKKIPGFTKFFNDVNDTKLSEEFSKFSFASVKNKYKPFNVPYTKFMGYTPYERNGFMVKMNSPATSTYPLIFPNIRADDDFGTRYSIEESRTRGGIQTVAEEKYAPNSLGKRPFVTNSIFATLLNQVPSIKTKAPAGSYIDKYSKTMTDKTDSLGYLTKWAITRRSPSPLDEQYLKFKLQAQSVNNEPAFFYQPYVVRGIQRDGSVDNQRWGGGFSVDDGLIRGGAVVSTERRAVDVIRISKWLASVKGGIFTAKQTGLQLMNPNVDVDPSNATNSLFGVPSTLIYNPVSVLANIGTAGTGVRFSRHGVNPLDTNYLNKYGKATTNRELTLNLNSPEYSSFKFLQSPTSLNRDPGGYNRLIGLMKELLPHSFSPILKIDKPSESAEYGPVEFSKALKDGVSRALDSAKSLFGITEIARVSSNFGGAQSFLGIGGTKIRRSSHPYLGQYTTAPLLYNTEKEPAYMESAKRQTFYSAYNLYSALLPEDLNEKELKKLSYLSNNGARLKNEDSISVNDSDVRIQENDLQRIKNSKAFNPDYSFFQTRMKRDNGLSPTNETLSDGNNPFDNDPNPIKNYRTLPYEKLQKPKPGDPRRISSFNDFRNDLQISGSESFIGNPKISRYEKLNLEQFYGFGKHGKVGAQRNIPFLTNIIYHSHPNSEKFVDQSGPAEFRKFSVPRLKNGQEFRGDRINIIDYKRANFNINKKLVYEIDEYGDPTLPGTNDLVEFYFSSLVLKGHNYCPAEIIVFRATFDSISDTHKPSWNAVKYMGRADPTYIYQGYERSISFGFTVHVTSRDEMKAIYRKLNYLASWTAPEYTKAGFIRGPLTRLNIGNLYRKMPGYIAGLTYTFDNTQGTWETGVFPEDTNLGGKGKELSSPGVLQLPKTIQVSCEFVPFGMYRPEFRGTFYSLYDDTGAGIENGLIPVHNTKTNYFKTFDDPKLDINSPDNKAYLPVPPGEETNIESGAGTLEQLAASDQRSTPRNP
ncbi:hypothetical protein [Microcystis phage Mel-JY01]